ncbi:duf833 domain containing protein [Grosmannia clavigera kw1407]|uniref:Duf833 domain containing protein n=1 Tax=Grosmannia clavigera (strain kw1407 / UAMH 11150) TaxID=655863 RepID=F0XQF6_GROCL|nr:duf833 domain containing protein [Grosmannia clavigera kw1407]EFX00232.1 duf833 domain containing protein [Grosmannia clavigera kw1407]
MCIALLTTAHPDYALIVIDNRDEFILRPTSRPHWWSPTGDDRSGSRLILSSRDLQRNEHGTWLGITRDGNMAVLTNFREENCSDQAHPVHGQRSRGGMVTAWLTADAASTTEQFVQHMLEGEGVRGVGGFSLICGKLRRRRGKGNEHRQDGIEPLAIISNRADELAQVPWIAGRRGEVYGLSNVCYDDPEVWPKVRDGKEALRRLVEASQDGHKDRPECQSADELRAALFGILDRDTLPQRPDLSFEDHIPLLKQSIFVPAIGDGAHRAAMTAAMAGGPREALSTAAAIAGADAQLAHTERPDEQGGMGFMTGLYGTQRQTVLLVDWHGNVSFTERALWDANGHTIPRGKGDVQFDFQIQGWDEDDKTETTEITNLA